MGVTRARVPVEFNVYWPTGANNSYVKDAVNYSNHTPASVDITDPVITEGSITSLAGHTNISYQTHSGSTTISTGTSATTSVIGLGHSTEYLVFTKTFTADSGYHYSVLNNSYIVKRVLERYPNMKLLGSYFLYKDGMHYWFEVILADPSHPRIAKDKEIRKRVLPRTK